MEEIEANLILADIGDWTDLPPNVRRELAFMKKVPLRSDQEIPTWAWKGVLLIGFIEMIRLWSKNLHYMFAFNI